MSWLNYRQLAVELEVSVKTVRRMTDAGMPNVKRGRGFSYDPAECRMWKALHWDSGELNGQWKDQDKRHRVVPLDEPEDDVGDLYETKVEYEAGMTGERARLLLEVTALLLIVSSPNYWKDVAVVQRRCHKFQAERLMLKTIRLVAEGLGDEQTPVKAGRPKLNGSRVSAVEQSAVLPKADPAHESGRSKTPSLSSPEDNQVPQTADAVELVDRSCSTVGGPESHPESAPTEEDPFG